MSLIVNMLAGPGAGKSTLSAQLFAELKMRGVCSELVAEYAKEWAWEGKKIQTIDEMIIYGRQLERERRFYAKDDMIAITDRPLELSCIYAAMYAPHRLSMIEHVVKSDREEAKKLGASFINVFVVREKEYSSLGRYESEEQALFIDKLTKIHAPIDVVYDSKSFNVKKLADLVQGFNEFDKTAVII